MPDPAFAQLVSQMTEAFGQKMGSSRQTPEGILLQTTDGFLYAFIAHPTDLSLATVQRFLSETPGGARHLVVFSHEHLPISLSAALLQAGATVVEGARFLELAHSLGLDSLVGEEPRPARAGSARLLPSAHQLDAVMGRARTWLDWGVPALALRFYRQAAEMKPEFQPAGAGVGTALLALGLASEAKAAFEELLRGDPSNLDSRIGLAAVLGVEGHPEQEIEAYRRLLTEDPDLLPVRAHLLAALIDHHHWAEARDELVTMLKKVPEDGRLRYLYAIALEKTGAGRAAQEEREKARHMGLTPDRERSLAEQLGLTPPRLASIAPPIPAAVLSQPPEVPAELVPGPEPLKPMAQPSGRSHKVRPRRALAPRKRAPRRTPRTDASSGRKAK